MHPANIRRLAAALGAALPVLLSIAAPRAAQDPIVTPISPGLTQTVTIGPPIVEQTTDPLTGLVTSQRTQDMTVVIDQIDRFDFNPCTAEAMKLNGRTVLRMKFTTGSDGRTHLVNHQDEQGKAVGTLSGATYVLNSTNEETDNFGGSGASEFTIAIHQNYIRTGETVGGDDWFQHMTFHLTIVNGVPTSVHTDNVRNECQ